MKPFNQSGAFHPTVAEGEVYRRAVRGAGATLLSGGLGLAIQVVGTVILARLLTPNDFGVVTMVTTFSLLLVNFGLNGFTEAIIQVEEIDEFVASNIFWINVSAGVLLTVGFAAAGSLLARFYHDPVVANVTIGVSLTIFITSLSVQHLALLKRAMYFSATSANEFVSRAGSLAVSVILAWGGYGYWALVLGGIAQPLFQTLGAWYLCNWIPKFPRRAPGTAALTRFAISVYGRFTVSYFTRNTDNLLVGWRFGAISLGFYKKAYDLFALSAGQLTSPLTNVAVSALSRFKPRSAQYRAHVVTALSLIAFVSMGLSAILTLIGKDLIPLLLGPGWTPAGRIFTFFAPGIGAMIIYYMHSWIHLSIGRADRWFRWGIVEVSATCLMFLIALPWGPTGIAVAWTASFWILTVPAFWYAGKPIDFGIAPLIAAVWRFVLAALSAGLVTVAIRREASLAFAKQLPPAAGIAITSALFGILYVSAVRLLCGSWKPLHQLVKMFREMTLVRSASKVASNPLISSYGEKPADVLSPGHRPRPLVSILIPAFNAERMIADTLRSAIAQTWDPKEIIVVDDGSTDRTLAIARQYESETVRVITQKNQGAAAARNNAYSLSTGDYIQWLDADDLLAPDKIATQMEVLRQCDNKRKLFSSSFGLFKYRYYRAEFIPSVLWTNLSNLEWLLGKMGQNAYMQTSTWLVSRELTEAAGPWNTALMGDDDGEYFCRVLLASEGVQFVPAAKVYYRAPWVGTLSYVGRSDRKLRAHWLSMQLHVKYLRSLEDSERVRNACLTYLSTSFAYFYPEHTEIIQEIKKLAAELGGELRIPGLSWKYSWVQAIFGWNMAKRMQKILPEIRWWFDKSWDKSLFELRSFFSVGGVLDQSIPQQFEAGRTAEAWTERKQEE